MARPPKEGLSYFPVDVYFDEKVKSIEHLFGNDGTKWVLTFWQTAYKTLSGEVRFDGVYGTLFAIECRITPEKHAEILRVALDVEFCFMTEPESYTSNGVQKRIAQIMKERKEAKERKNKRKEKECPISSVVLQANNSGTIVVTAEQHKELIEKVHSCDVGYGEEEKRIINDTRLSILDKQGQLLKSKFGKKDDESTPDSV
jgi:hypothetical protein